MRDALPQREPTSASGVAGRRGVYLPPGELFASAEPVLVSTILGSCVAVCLFDADARVGGVNHFLLPPVGPSAASPRFGPHAFSELRREVERLGARSSALKAKVFGGSCGLSGTPIANAIGAKNVGVAFRLLAEAGIEVAAHETGGTRARRVLFETDTGWAWVRRL